MASVDSLGLTVTECAVSKIRSVLEKEEQPSLLRLSVQGGGCAGFKYEFTTEVRGGSLSVDDEDDDCDSEIEDVDDEDEEDEDEEGDVVGGASDIVVSAEDGVPLLLIDRCSRKFLKNSTIDYVEDMNGSRFVVNNPGVKFGCGCGNSFSL
ncbi:HesB/IscA family protein [Anaplasma platys]|nr:iron-sulfur cluster assembly accessory protein [Anaplasma platys]